MGFAAAYLLKAGLRELLFPTDPHPGLKMILTIPVHNESGLERCLDSLFLSASQFSGQTEVLILINASAHAPEAVLKQNQVTFSATKAWIARHPHPSIQFFVWLDHGFGKKEAGVGLARKILMDEAVRRFDAAGNPQGIIASLDADVVVDANYLEALASHFEASNADGCSIYFEHPLGPGEDCGERSPGKEAYGPEIYEAIAQYELHLRYYLHAVRSTGYPYAFYTVGSSFAVRADVYCLEGGMNKRQGGEDFYFIQKVAQRGHWSACNSTRVIASPRPSDRVPFGTGPVVSRLSADRQPLTTYHPEPFRMLGGLFSEIDRLYPAESAKPMVFSLPKVLSNFLETQDFLTALTEIRRNSGSPEAFVKRFWRWFNMFRIMKFLHYAREQGYPDVNVGEAAMELLRQQQDVEDSTTDSQFDLKELLLQYKNLDRSAKY